MISLADERTPLNIDLSKDCPIYDNHDRKVVDSVVLEMCRSIPCMVEGRPYDALFLLWPLWSTRPNKHHCTLGTILSEIVQSGVLPLMPMPGAGVGSTRVLYFLDRSRLQLCRINQSLVKPNRNS